MEEMKGEEKKTTGEGDMGEEGKKKPVRYELWEQKASVFLLNREKCHPKFQ